MGEKEPVALEGSSLPLPWKVAIGAVASIAAMFVLVMFMVAWNVSSVTDSEAVARLTAQGQLLVSAAGLIVSVVLAAITAWYAWTTRAMVIEMKSTRLQDVELRRREKIEAAAARALAAVHDSRIGTYMGRQSEVEAADRLARQLRQHSPLIADPVLADRVNACAEVARAYAIDTEAEWQDHDRGLAVLRLRQIVEATRWSLEAYLADQDLPGWQALPMTTSAFAWAHGPSLRHPDLAD